VDGPCLFEPIWPLNTDFWGDVWKVLMPQNNGVMHSPNAYRVWLPHPFMCFLFSFLLLSPPRIPHQPLQKIRQVPAIYFPFIFGQCPFDYHFFSIFNKSWNYKCFVLKLVCKSYVKLTDSLDVDNNKVNWGKSRWGIRLRKSIDERLERLNWDILINLERKKCPSSYN
jgi:hypothetical protein